MPRPIQATMPDSTIEKRPRTNERLHVDKQSYDMTNHLHRPIARDLEVIARDGHLLRRWTDRIDAAGSLSHFTHVNSTG